MTETAAGAVMPTHFADVARVYGEVRTTDPEPVRYVRDALADRARRGPPGVMRDDR